MITKKKYVGCLKFKKFFNYYFMFVAPFIIETNKKTGILWNFYFLKHIFNNLITGASNIKERINANRKDTTAFPKNDVNCVTKEGREVK